MVVLLGVIFPGWPERQTCRELSGPCLSVFSVYLGFVFASMSMLLGMIDRPFLRGMQQTGALDQLIVFHWSCARWCALGMAASIAAFFWPDAWYAPWQGVIFMAVGLATSLSAFRIARLFAKIIRNLEK